MLNVKLFGGVQFSSGSVPIDITRPRVRHLACLMAESIPDWIHEDALVDDLWPDQLPKNPRSALQVVVSRLRSTLSDAGLDQVVESSQRRYRFDPQHVSVDVHEWRQAVDRGLRMIAEGHADGLAELDAAAKLWHERGIDVSVASERLHGAAEATRQRDVDARTIWAEFLGDRGAWADALVIAEPAHRRAPLSEALASVTARSFWQVGRQNDAMATCARHHDALRDELGLSPTPTFLELEQQLLEPPSVRTDPGSAADERSWSSNDMRTLAAVLASDESPPGLSFVGDSRRSALFAQDLDDALRHANSVVRMAGTDIPQALRGDTTATSRDRTSELARAVDQLVGAAQKTVLIIEDCASLGEWGCSLVEYAVSSRAPVVIVLTGEAAPMLSDAGGLEQRTFDAILTRTDEVSNDAPPVEIDDDDVRELLEIAAIAGRQLDPILISDLAEKDLGHTAALLERAPSGLLEPAVDASGRLRFARETDRQTLLRAVDPIRHAQVSAAAGQLLADRTNDWPKVANLLLAGGDWSERNALVAACTKAAAATQRSGEYVRSSGFYEEAAKRTDGDDSLLFEAQSAECLELAGLVQEADAKISDILSRINPGDHLDLLARVAMIGGGHGSRVGGQALRRSRLALARHRLPEGHPQHDAVLVEYVSEQLSAISPLDAEDAEAVRRISRDDTSTAQLLARRIVLVMDELAGSAVDVSELVQLARQAQRSSAPAWQRAAGLVVPIQLGLVNGHWVKAEGWIDELSLIGQQSGDPRARWQSLAFRAALASGRGAPKEASRVAYKALTEGLASGMGDAQTTYAMHQIGTTLLSGSLASFAPQLEATGEKYDYRILALLRAIAQYDIGNEKAARDLLRHADQVRRFGDPYTVAADATTVLLAERIGAEQALQAADEALANRSERFVFCGYGGPYLGPVASFRSVAQRALDNPEAADRLGAEAQEDCAAAGARLPVCFQA